MSSPGGSSPRGNPNRMTNSGWRDQGDQGDEDEDFITQEERDKTNFSSLKEQGCTIDAELYDELCQIRNALLEDKAEF